MVFGFFTDAIENALGVATDILTGEVPTKRAIDELVADYAQAIEAHATLPQSPTGDRQ